jgi:hypothetical protein
MSQALRFADYDQFNFPTVRESARKVAQGFGIGNIYEKYRMNKELLESMIQANKRKTQSHQDSIKNMFLLLLSAIAAIGTLGEIFYAIYADEKGGLFCYVAAMLLVVVGYLIYVLCLLLYRVIMKQRKGKKE